MRCRRSWFAFEAHVGLRVREEAALLTRPISPHHPANPCNEVIAMRYDAASGLDGYRRLSFSCAFGAFSGTEEEEDAMQESEIQDYARQLLEAHGDKAVADAAQKASALEGEGDNEQAATWRRIEAALKLMRGPHQK
jgi:hypothetical protein